jgi:hypothetical protein
LVYDIFWKEILGIKKVLLPATSDDAASDSDTKKKNHEGIWYMILFEERFLYPKSIAASRARCCCER